MGAEAAARRAGGPTHAVTRAVALTPAPRSPHERESSSGRAGCEGTPGHRKSGTERRVCPTRFVVARAVRAARLRRPAPCGRQCLLCAQRYLIKDAPSATAVVDITSAGPTGFRSACVLASRASL